MILSRDISVKTSLNLDLPGESGGHSVNIQGPIFITRYNNNALYVIIIFNICLGAGSRQYCRYTKSPLGITPLKEIWESPRVKENLTSVGFEPTTSGLDLPMLYTSVTVLKEFHCNYFFRKVSITTSLKTSFQEWLSNSQRGWGKTTKKMAEGVGPAPKNPLPDLWPKSAIFPTLSMTWPKIRYSI